MVPEALIVDDIRAARLYRLLPKYKSGRRPTFVPYPSRRHLAPCTRVVIGLLIEQINQAAARLAQDDVWATPTASGWCESGEWVGLNGGCRPKAVA
jgi:hypothetical protein